MSKLLRLKQWLSVEDAAKHLSAILEDEVREVDIYRLALDMKLTLSVIFPQSAPYGVLFEPVPDDDLEYVEMPALDGNGTVRVMANSAVLAPNGAWLQMHSKSRFPLEDDYPYDLAMVGGEFHDLQHRFWKMTGAEIEDTISIDGVFVKDFDKFIRLEDVLPSKSEERGFYPIGSLPENARFVVRPKALSALEAMVTDAPQEEAFKPLAIRERTSLLNIIGALLEQTSTKEAALIANMIERHPSMPGISKRTLEAKFAEAKRSLRST